MNPRASIPTTLSTFPRPKCTTIKSVMVENAIGSASTGVMSLNTMPGSGKSGTSRISALICSISTVSPPFAFRPLPLRPRLRPRSAPSSGTRDDPRRRGVGGRGDARAGRLRALGLGRGPKLPGLAPNLQVLVARLPFLQDDQHRCSDEDRRIRADRHSHEHREREVL